MIPPYGVSAAELQVRYTVVRSFGEGAVETGEANDGATATPAMRKLDLQRGHIEREAQSIR